MVATTSAIYKSKFSLFIGETSLSAISLVGRFLFYFYSNLSKSTTIRTIYLKGLDFFPNLEKSTDYDSIGN